MKYTIIVLMILGFYAAAQDQSTSGFKEYYPISVRPELSAGLGNNPYEQILLEAKPTVYYGIYNDLRSALNKDTITSGDAIYLTFQPEFRIYNEESKPVKTPSYKLLIGWQKIIKTDSDNFLTAAIESGHYSNGQSRSAFSTEFEDDSEESRALYDEFTDDTNLAALLNRQTGNFSTNLTRFSINYRLNKFDSQNVPEKIHSMTATYQLYHNKFLGVADFGGYNPEDIEIYGRHRIELGYEYTGYYKDIRYVISEQALLHLGSHPSSVPYRSETRFMIYPFSNDFGFMTQLSIGRDDYNYRFLEDFTRFSVGITWDWFTPFVIKPTRQQLPDVPDSQL
ncbi:hypothetical protein SAMN05192588_0845 [Nonlabens sp. Hel1_33_55]|uniref:hypothetical protein n=1 Tax=Nonlabens sp. Hel1_33_55 TaxID=1336802 RepID=UPI000875D865|nr:hypothetical protein [Nonlabens sp. Hel1_33_55]SCY03882.1 hypothetical protein SAMN05192588_0845 [Nonlabens sp. Hel1_33_55]